MFGGTTCSMYVWQRVRKRLEVKETRGGGGGRPGQAEALLCSLAEIMGTAGWGEKARLPEERHVDPQATHDT